MVAPEGALATLSCEMKRNERAGGIEVNGRGAVGTGGRVGFKYI
jgi:hypothetical protein